MSDYISRSWLLKNTNTGMGVIELMQAIIDAPAADVRQVGRGKWIEYTRVVVPEPYNKWEQAWKCDKCGFDDGFPAYSFCPNCGADMREEDNHE